jgi:hypothetical protein
MFEKCYRKLKSSTETDALTNASVDDSPKAKVHKRR